MYSPERIYRLSTYFSCSILYHQSLFDAKWLVALNEHCLFVMGKREFSLWSNGAIQPSLSGFVWISLSDRAFRISCAPLFSTFCFLALPGQAALSTSIVSILERFLFGAKPLVWNHIVNPSPLLWNLGWPFQGGRIHRARIYRNSIAGSCDLGISRICFKVLFWCMPCNHCAVRSMLTVSESMSRTVLYEIMLIWNYAWLIALP